MKILDYLHAIALLEASRDIVGMLAPDAKKLIKSKLRNFDQQFTPAVYALKELAVQTTPKEGRDSLLTYIDDMGATSSEVVREYCKAKDKKEFLALCMAYNEGSVKIDA